MCGLLHGNKNFKRLLMLPKEYCNNWNNTPWKVSASCQFLLIHSINLCDIHRNTYRIYIFGSRWANLKLIWKNILAQRARKIQQKEGNDVELAPPEVKTY